jgi:hypothetical protein
MYPSKNVNLCLFYASEQAKVIKMLLKVYTISHGRHIFTHIQVGGLGGSGGWGGKPLTGKNWHGKREAAWHFGPEDLAKTKFIIIYCKKSMDRAF